MSKPTRIYTNVEKTVTVEWRPELCTHCGKCLEGLPKVFNLNSRPWILINNGSPEAIKHQVAQCPSKAISCP